jgi:hypothetical protein
MSISFTTQLAALKLQLATVFDDAGGELALELLDALSKLEPKTRSLFLKSTIRTLHHLVENASDPTLPLSHSSSLLHAQRPSVVQNPTLPLPILSPARSFLKADAKKAYHLQSDPRSERRRSPASSLRLTRVK